MPPEISQKAMVMARVVEFVKRASHGFLSFCKDSLRVYCLLTLLQVPAALCASTAQVYEIGNDVTEISCGWITTRWTRS